MRINNKLLLRKIKLQLPQFLASILIIGLGTGLFVTLKTVRFQYEKVSEKYYEDHVLADYTVYGENFSHEDVEKVKQQKGVEDIQGRYVYDFRSGEAVIRCISIENDGARMNIPYLFEGTIPRKSNECMLIKKYADSYGLRVGENIEIKLPQGEYSFKITALIASPEYVYFAKSESVPMADPHDFGVAFFNEAFFKETLKTGYNQLNVMFAKNERKEAVTEVVKNVLVSKKIIASSYKEGQISYKSYQEDLGQIESFAYILPIIFLFVASMIIYVMQRRNIAIERKQIGIMKALGIMNWELIWLYSRYVLLIALVGSALGCTLGVVFGDYILTLFSGMFELPGLSFVVLPRLWISAFLIALFVCQLSSYMGIRKLLGINAAEAMHAEKPKTGKRIILERIKPLWRSLSFNSRYAFKNAFRNKGRFLGVVSGMSAMVLIMIFSLGFNDSFSFLIKNHYENFTKYDAVVNLQMTKYEAAHEILTLPQINAFEKALIIPVTVESKGQKRDYPLLVIDKDFKMMDLKNAEGDRIKLDGGVVLPEYIAQKLGIQIGDKIKLSASGDLATKEIQVVDLSKQGTGFFVYCSYDYFVKEIKEGKKLYNTVFINTKDVKGLFKELEKNKSIIGYTSTETDKNSMLQVFKTVQALINFLILFAIMLGLAVLYAVGMINLTARNYEFVLLKVMGYELRDIMKAHFKETIIQLSLAIPLGVALGRLVLEGIKGEFSNDSFALTPFIGVQSYILTISLLLGTTILIGFFSGRHIRRIDMVEGLKSRDD